MSRNDCLSFDSGTQSKVTGNMFQKCSCCGRIWQSRSDFLIDGLLTFNGYQADFEAPEMGLFLFTHRAPGCGTTIAIEVRYFRDLYDGPVYTERKTNTSECPGHCLHVASFERCETHCECAYVRQLMQRLTEIRINGVR